MATTNKSPEATGVSSSVQDQSKV